MEMTREAGTRNPEPTGEKARALGVPVWSEDDLDRALGGAA